MLCILDGYWYHGKYGHFEGTNDHLKCKTNNTMKYLREADRVSEFDQKGRKGSKRSFSTKIFRP